MNDNQRFDDHIKDQFNDYSPDVHPRIWENIVNKREKRKPVGFWLSLFNGRNILLLTALLLAGGSGAYFLLNPSSTNKENNTATAGAAPTVPSIQQNNNTQTITTEAQTDNSSGNSKNNITPDNTALNGNTPTGTPQPKGSTAKSAITDTDASETINSRTPHNNFSNAGASKIKIHRPIIQTGADAAKTTFNKHSGTTTTSEYDIADEENADQHTGDLYQKRLLFAGLQKEGYQKKAAELTKKFSINVFLPDCPSVEKNAAGNKTYVEIYGGPDFALRSLNDTGNSAYLQKRKESTKFASAFSAGLRYTRVFNNGMSIRTGVNYSQINEKFTFTQGNLVQVTYIIDVNGDTTGSYITTGTRYKTTINRFRTLDIPLLIGYEMGNGRIHTNINAGVIVNIYSWQKGEVLDASFKPVSITTGKSNSPYQFKTNMGVGFMAGASVYYKLNEKAHLLAEPYFRYNLSPMSSDKLTFSQKYNTIGLRIGLRIDLR